MLISVIIPIYNVEKYLDNCIQSVVNQTYGDFELILVDDGSTDKSGKICDEYAEHDSRIIVIHQKNAGVSAARNKGISIAQGKYFCFIDSDDYINIDYFERVSQYLKNKKLDLLINNYFFQYENGMLIKSFVNSDDYFCDSDSALIAMAKGEQFNWSPIAKFYKNLQWDVKFNPDIVFGEDLLFNYEFIKKCKVVHYVPLSKYHYICRDGSACTSYTVEKKIDDLKAMEIILKKEDSEFGDILFAKEYLPRLITYYKESLIGDDIAVQALIKDKCKQSLTKGIKNTKVSKMLLCKLLACLLPQNIFQCLLGVHNLLKRK